MRKSLKVKQSKAKPVRWSARRAKALMTPRSSGRAGYCNCGK